MTPTVFSEHGRKGLDLIKEMPWTNLKTKQEKNLQNAVHTEGIRHCTRTIVNCEFSRYSGISIKSVRV